MGIQNRDYMKRPSDDDGGSPSDSKAEEFARRFMQKYPRFFLYVCIGLGVLIAIAIVAVKFSRAAD